MSGHDGEREAPHEALVGKDQMDKEPRAAPQGRYVRQVAGADFSLEANTDRTPAPDVFYVFQGDDLRLETPDFAEAEACYRSLCQAHWEGGLASSAAAERVSSAWGLLGQDLDHRAAAGVIQEDGGPASEKRLQQIKNRRRFGKRAKG